MNKLIASSLLALTACFASLTYANCPALSQVTYGCATIGGQKHCNWSAPWYEGFSEEDAQPNEKAASFIRVFWGAKDKKVQPGDTGSTVCFYKSPHGNIIELVQNDWGNVVYPEQANWTNGDWEGYPGRQCSDATAGCQFSYPTS